MDGPRFSERDARLLTTKIVHAIRTIGATVTTFGLHLDRDGFWFRAEINGRDVWVRTGQGNFHYDRVAAELVHAASVPRDDTLTIQKDRHA